MIVECTIHEPWLEECRLQVGNYFHIQDPIPALHDQQDWVCYREINNTKQKMTINTILLITIVTAQSYRLPTEVIWCLLKENSLLQS